MDYFVVLISDSTSKNGGCIKINVGGYEDISLAMQFVLGFTYAANLLDGYSSERPDYQERIKLSDRAYIETFCDLIRLES